MNLDPLNLIYSDNESKISMTVGLVNGDYKLVGFSTKGKNIGNSLEKNSKDLDRIKLLKVGLENYFVIEESAEAKSKESSKEKIIKVHGNKLESVKDIMKKLKNSKNK